ncbi:MAG: hypothetical protein JXA36_05970, partial [Coriobacteriia bacterium]|nr:hypothetical protein [Coriobacteriia bacterium]
MERKSALIALILLTCLLRSAYGQRGYTGFGEFWEDTSAFNVRYTINFDDLASGANASVRGVTEIGAEGLLSDGASLERLIPIASNTYAPHSSPNSLGAAGDNQFLAGNSDKVTFTFARPIYAFGLYLIGNPSPTGSPAIPFWRMRACLPVPAEVFSATEPLSSLGPGDEVYFLGIVSEEPFTEAQLFSDNDPAAVYSFNIDDMVWCTNATAASSVSAKSLANGTDILLSGVIVTREHSDRFNVETADRSSGIAVCGLGGYRNRDISLYGTLAMSPEGERVINLLQIISQTPATAPSPLGMTTRSVGGGAPSGLQIGCTESTGLNNIGLDVRITGRVTGVAADCSWMTVDDGFGRTSGMGTAGVCVVGEIGERREGELVRL